MLPLYYEPYIIFCSAFFCNTTKRNLEFKHRACLVEQDGKASVKLSSLALCFYFLFPSLENKLINKIDALVTSRITKANRNRLTVTI